MRLSRHRFQNHLKGNTMFTVGQKIRCVDASDRAGRALVEGREYIVREVGNGVRVDDTVTGRVIPHEYDVARFTAATEAGSSGAPAVEAPAVEAPAETVSSDAPQPEKEEKKCSSVFAEAIASALGGMNSGAMKDAAKKHAALEAVSSILSATAVLIDIANER
jgi:hypothetical protein